MKRGMFIAVILISLLSLSLASAQSVEGVVSDINKVIEGFVDIVTPVSAMILGDIPGGEYLFAKVLFLILILAIVWYGLEQIDFFSGNVFVHWIVAIIVAVIATRWIVTKGIIETILLPYTTLGVAIAAGLPFVIYFALINIGFKERRYAIIRKIAWIFFAVIFVALWIMRYDRLGNARWIYPITAVLSILMLIFDGTITSFVRRWVHEHGTKVDDLMRRNELQNQLDDLKDLRKDLIKRGEKATEIRKVDKRIDKLVKDISKI